MKTTLLKSLARGLFALAVGASTSLQAQLVDKTPVLHLSFDKVSGSTAGSIVTNTGSGGLGMNGTLYETADGTVSIVPGKFGNALYTTGNVDANDSAVRVNNAVVPLNGTATWTVAMWIKTPTGGGAYAYQGPFNGGWNGGNTMFYLNSANGTAGGTWAGGVRNGQDWVQGTTALNDDLWHHIAVTCDGTIRTVWVDGQFERTDTSWSGTGSGAAMWFGGSGNTGDGSAHLNGLVDEVYVFNQALNTNDILGLFNSNVLPVVPVSVTVNPASGYRGQVGILTGTVTPGAGTITNVTANLSAINLSASTNMGVSSANVYTNMFVVPTNAPIGARNLSVTARTTADPFIGSGGATFTVIARPPTNAILVAQLTNTTVVEYTGASFHFGTTNDAPNDAPFPMAYSWYTNGVLVSSNMGPNFTFLTTPDHNGMQIQAIARVSDTNFGSLTVTSAVVTLTVTGGSQYYVGGLKEEFFGNNATRANVELGNVAKPTVRKVTAADSPGLGIANHSRRYSGYFIPQTSDFYTFFVASDDDCDVFLSTDSNPANKRLIAQETTWSGTRVWQASTASVNSQKRSDQWTNSLGETPWVAGIELMAGTPYYFEAVMRQGGGGDNWAVTYQTKTELDIDPSLPLDGTLSRMTAASNNIAFRAYPGTSLTWSLQPLAAVSVFEGQTTNFTSLAISDGELLPNYQWYLNNAPIGANSATLTLNAIPPSYNNAQIKVVASNVLSGLSITSTVTTLTVKQAVFEPGWVTEKKWMDVFSINGPDLGTLGEPTITGVRQGFFGGLNNPGAGGSPNGHDSTVQQIGSFVAPSNGLYVFFVSSHDGANLFLGTNNTPTSKRLIAQEAGWTSGWNWNSVGGGGSVVSQKRSDQFSPDGGVTTPYAAGIQLVAGQRYYMQVDHTTSLWGNERWGVIYQIVANGIVDPPDGSLPNVLGSVVGASAIRCSYVNFTQQPTDVVAPPMGYAVFSASGETDSLYPVISSTGYTITQPTNKLFFQWYKNGQPIPGATTATLSLGPVLPSDNGAQIYCAMRALGYANDALQPIWTNSMPATLTVSPEAVFETGVAMVEWWTNNANRTSVQNGSAGPAHRIYTTPKFIAPNNTGTEIDNYANRISGFFIPPADGLYTFFLNSDDDSDLFLSTNESPSNKRLVARVTGWSGSVLGWNATGGGGDSLTQRRSDQFVDPTSGLQPFAAGIPLVAGQKYYIEGVHNEGGGGDYFAATYSVYGGSPNDGDDTLITGDAIGFYAPRIPWMAFTAQPQSVNGATVGNSVTFTGAGTNAPSIVIGDIGRPTPWFNNPTYLMYQWYKNGTPIEGANSSSYTLNPVLPSDNNAQFVLGIRAMGYANNSLVPIYSNSVPAVLTVAPDNTPPTITYSATFENSNQVPFGYPSQFIVNVTFSEWMDATTLSNAVNYSIAGVNILGVRVASDNRTVELLVNQMPTLPLNITVNGVKDLSGNTIVPGSTTAINSVKLTFTDVGNPTVDPTYPSLVSVTADGGYIITAQGSDIWNTADGFNFAWEIKTNDFDVAVRQVSNGHSSHWAKGGLMVRETLDAGSRNWNIINNPASSDGIMAPDNSGLGANTVDSNARVQTGGTSAGWDNITRPPVAYPNAWVRLKRTGSVLQAFYSTNGMTWVQTAYTDTATNAFEGALVNPVYVGLATTAHNNDAFTGIPPAAPLLYYNTVEYANYNSSFVPSAPAAQLTVSRSGNSINISWSPAGGHLESSPAIGGAGVNWQPVGGGNPATVPIGPGPQFFRVVNP